MGSIKASTTGPDNQWFFMHFFLDRATCNLVGRIVYHNYLRNNLYQICRNHNLQTENSCYFILLFYNRSIRSIKRLNHKNSLYEFYILVFFLPESFCAYLALFFPLLPNAARTTFSLFNIHSIFMKRPRKMWGLVLCIYRRKEIS